MRCSACNREIAAFPGSVVRCACGRDVEVPLQPREARESGGPYRAAAPLPASFPERRIAGTRGPRHVEGTPVCPRCGAPLHGLGGEIDSVAAVLECAACRGLFVAHSMLEETLRERRGATYEMGIAVDANEVRYLACPRCTERMSRRLFGKRTGLVVDVCSLHGIWFDVGEVERAAEVPPEARAEVPLLGETPRKGSKPAPRLSPEAARALVEAEAAMRREGYGLREIDGPPRDVLDVLISLFLG